MLFQRSRKAGGSVFSFNNGLESVLNANNPKPHGASIPTWPSASSAARVHIVLLSYPHASHSFNPFLLFVAKKTKVAV